MDKWRISNVITQQRVNKSICHKTKIFGGIFNCEEKAAGSHFNCWAIDILNSTRNNFPVSMASVPPPTMSLCVLNPKIPGRKLKTAPGSFVCLESQSSGNSSVYNCVCDGKLDVTSKCCVLPQAITVRLSLNVLVDLKLYMSL